MKEPRAHRRGYIPEGPRSWVSCEPCGKRLYPSRAAAKKVTARLKHLDESRPRPYRCPRGSDGWHLGHLPGDVIRGEVSREEVQENMDRRDGFG